MSGYLLTVTAVSSEGMGRGVFVFSRAPRQGGLTADVFSHVATSVDMEDVPERAPDSRGPFYRADTATFYMRTLEEREDLVRVIREDLDMLVAALSLDASVTETVEHGGG